MLLISACGTRSEIGGGLFDGSFGFDATTSDVVIHADGSPSGGPDAGADVALEACTPISVGVACAGPGPGDCKDYGCKFNVEWQCGTTKWRVGGGCAPPDAAGPLSGTYEGVCEQNGQQTSSFQTPTTTCDCQDASALVTVLEEKCTQQ